MCAAAATEGRQDEVLAAVADLQPGLADYRSTIQDFAGTVEGTVFVSPTSDFVTPRTELDAASELANSVCDASQGEDCTALALLLGEATAALQNAQDKYDSVNSFSLVGGSNPLFPRLTLDEFNQFLIDTAGIGAAALPLEEILLSDLLVLEAGTFFPSMSSFGPAIAAYDAKGDTDGRESALFDPVTSDIDLAELLHGSATVLSSKGYWLNIDLDQSPLVQINEPRAAMLLLMGWVLLLRFAHIVKGRR